MKIKATTLVNIALATILLTSIFLISAIPSSSVSKYDPWVDLDGNGKIDIYDLVAMAGTYGTTGDPVRNVSVSNLPLDENGNLKVASVAESKLVTICYNQEISCPTTEQVLGSLDISGWKYATIWVFGQSTATFDLNAYYKVGNLRATFYIRDWGLGGGSTPFSAHETLSPPIPAPSLEFTIRSPVSGQVNLTVYVYLSNIT